MIESMFSGISGLQVHKEKMNVIGNDIANVNTVGYKQRDMTFKEAFVTTLRRPVPGLSGIQNGLGVQVGTITRDFSDGALMETGRTSNLGISGEGLFVVSSESPQAQMIDAISRMGEITPATAGRYDIDIDINGTVHTLSVDLRPGETPQEVVDKLNNQISATFQGAGFAEPATGWVTAGNATTINLELNGGGVVTVDANGLGALADGDDAATMVGHLNANLLAVAPAVAAEIEFVESPAGEIQLRPINPDNVQSLEIQTTTFTEELGFTTSTPPGIIRAVNIADSVEFELNLGAVRLAPKIGDMDFNSLSIADGTAGGAMALLGYPADGAAATFGEDRVFFSRAGDFELDVQDNNLFMITPEGRRLQGVMGDPPQEFGPNSVLEDVDLRRGLDPAQRVTSYVISPDGVIRRSVDGGPLSVIGRVALAIPGNPAGLESVGSNLYRPSEAAGVTEYRGPDERGGGQVFQGYLENSNVDLAREFTEMILTQRGYQANSRTISTSDEMLQELLTLKR